MKLTKRPKMGFTRPNNRLWMKLWVNYVNMSWENLLA